jgi:hypothetical protein
MEREEFDYVYKPGVSQEVLGLTCEIAVSYAQPLVQNFLEAEHEKAPVKRARDVGGSLKVTKQFKFFGH